MPEVAIAVAVLDPEGDRILDRLARWASFATEPISGGRRVTVGNVESEGAARASLAESLDDVAPTWRDHLRF